MDAHPEAPLSAGPMPARPLLDHDEFRTIFSDLSQYLCQRLISLRAGFDLLLGNSAQPIATDQRGHMETMAGLCDDLLRLTRGYLDYAGLVQGVRPPCYGTFTIGALIREIDRQFASRAASTRIGWECGVDGPDATVTTDASRCQQVFANIVANALRFTPEGGRVRIQGRSEGDHWCVVVSDTGAGIPRDSVGKVFEPFFRLPSDARSGAEGNGLGLAICRELVAQMGGEIHLDSTLGQGTRVRLRLPREGVPPGRS